MQVFKDGDDEDAARAGEYSRRGGENRPSVAGGGGGPRRDADEPQRHAGRADALTVGAPADGGEGGGGDGTRRGGVERRGAGEHAQPDAPEDPRRLRGEEGGEARG